MRKKYEITAEQKAELEAAWEENKDKRVEKRIKALLLRSAGKTNGEIGGICEYHPARVSQLVFKYCKQGIGAIIEVSAVKAAYEAKVGHTVGGSQIYYVLHRHGWRKIMPRGRHPKKANDKAIEALTGESRPQKMMCKSK